MSKEKAMAKFVYLYTGGQMADTPAAQEEQMQAWGAWFGTLGESVTDMGAPFGTSATVGSSGTSDQGASKIGGYSIITADSLEDAKSKAKGCPVAETGGSVEIYEALPM